MPRCRVSSYPTAARGNPGNSRAVRLNDRRPTARRRLGRSQWCVAGNADPRRQCLDPSRSAPTARIEADRPARSPAAARRGLVRQPAPIRRLRCPGARILSPCGACGRRELQMAGAPTPAEGLATDRGVGSRPSHTRASSRRQSDDRRGGDDDLSWMRRTHRGGAVVCRLRRTGARRDPPGHHRGLLTRGDVP